MSNIQEKTTYKTSKNNLPYKEIDKLAAYIMARKREIAANKLKQTKIQ